MGLGESPISHARRTVLCRENCADRWTPPAQSSTVIRSIQVVDLKELQPAVRSKVDDVVAQTSEEDLQSQVY